MHGDWRNHLLAHDGRAKQSRSLACTQKRGGYSKNDKEDEIDAKSDKIQKCSYR